MGMEIIQDDDHGDSVSDSISDSIYELVKLVKEKNQNVGSVSVIMSGRFARLMIHFRYDEDPITEIPDEFVDEDGSVPPHVEEFYSSYNRMMPYGIVIDGDKIDIEEHAEEITRRLTRRV